MIDIIVVTYKAKKNLQCCLESISEHTKDFRYTVTVVDNYGENGVASYLDECGIDRVRLIAPSKNLGFCGAANIALKATRNNYIVFMDDDVEATGG